MQCHVSNNAFALVYTTSDSLPRQHIVVHKNACAHELVYETVPQQLGLVVMLFYKRDMDDVTQFIGSSLLDLSQCSEKTYHMSVFDSSNRPPVNMGVVSLDIVEKPFIVDHLDIQSPSVARQGFDAAESNLNLIQGFGNRGLPPIAGPGLVQIHSPYYVNHMGMTLPSGAYCMIPTSIDQDKVSLAVESHRQRFEICLCRNNITAEMFQKNVVHLMTSGLKAKHIKCLCTLADTLTLHTRLVITYTPDVIHTKNAPGTERWELPREPTIDGKMSFVGDCEDFSREVYQHAKEIMSWVEPRLNGTPFEALSALLHMYVPTIEQGAVDKDAVSDEQRKLHPNSMFRNHIWAALHPRESFRVKLEGAKLHLERLYDRWPVQKCERSLPLLFLEGTGDVFPVTDKVPEFVKKMKARNIELENMWPSLCDMTRPRINLQFAENCEDCPFYKYAIACMTDMFSDQGMIDFTYVSGNKYGVDITDWVRGRYRMRSSCKHSKDTMEIIKNVLTLERPIQPILTTSSVVTPPPLDGSFVTRFCQDSTIEQVPPHACLGEYRIHDKTLYELYFSI